jgi:hypothetical protein
MLASRFKQPPRKHNFNEITDPYQFGYNIIDAGYYNIKEWLKYSKDNIVFIFIESQYQRVPICSSKDYLNLKEYIYNCNSRGNRVNKINLKLPYVKIFEDILVLYSQLENYFKSQIIFLKFKTSIYGIKQNFAEEYARFYQLLRMYTENSFINKYLLNNMDNNSLTIGVNAIFPTSKTYTKVELDKIVKDMDEIFIKFSKTVVSKFSSDPFEREHISKVGNYIIFLEV